MNAQKVKTKKTIIPQRMKAAVCVKYGSPDFLKIKDMPVPTPNENEVLVKVQATSVTKADTMLRRADPFISRFFLGFNKPKKPIVGTGFAGEIIQVGKEVSMYKLGDQVFGETGVNFSANAEYVCVPENGIIFHKPANITFEEAAPLCDGALTSWNFLKEIGQIKAGQKVLINGAAGSLGTAAIQIAKEFGAEVTAVCSSRNIDFVKSLGAEHVIDYTQQDFTQTGNTYDLIYDAVGKSSFLHSKRVLKKEGVYLSPVLKFGLLCHMIWTSIFGSKKAKFSATGMLPVPKLREMLQQLIRLVENGKIEMIISRTYSLDQISEAHRLVDTGHKIGNVVVTFE